MAIDIILADDHAVVRAGSRRLLEGRPNIGLITEVADTDALFTLCQKTEPDVVVLDLSIPPRGGMDCVRRLLAHYPDIHLMVFTIFDNPLLAERIIQAGALGFVTKASDADEYVAAVEKVAKGEIYISQDIVNELAMKRVKRQENLVDALSSREFDIFMRAVEGERVADIAKSLYLAEKTVSNYISQIKQKLKEPSTTKWVHIALQHGLLTSSGE